MGVLRAADGTLTIPSTSRPRYFRTPAAFGAWLAKHHASEAELWVGLYKKHAAHRGMTYLQAVDEALCWGWIDGVMHRVDDDRLAHRFTPRKAKSIWSLVNLGKVRALVAAGRMRPPGLAAFEAREASRTGIYFFEQQEVALTAAHARRFRGRPKAWRWFRAQGASYQRATIHWVNSAKLETTRERRLVSLIDHAGEGKRIPRFIPLADRKR